MKHLTDEQFASLMAGDRSDANARLHIDNCDICSRELASVGLSVDDLNRISMRWAEERAVRIQTPSAWALSWKVLPGWSATAAAVLIFGVALGAHVQNNNRAAVNVPQADTQQTMASPTTDELAQDNRLMQSINAEINEQPGVQMAVSALDDSSHGSRRHGLREVSN